MGFLTTISADKLSAVYHTATRQLYLTAKGSAQNFTSGIAFHQNTLFGGLKFTLMGWVGPRGTGTTPYDKTQHFNVSLPQPHFNNKTVLIVTSNHPDGIAVPITYFVGEAIDSELSDGVKGSAPTPVRNNVPRTVFLDTNFTIKANVVAGILQSGGSVDINWDKSALTLMNAGVEGADMVWTFKAIKDGMTNVVVTFSGGMAPITWQQVHAIDVMQPIQ